VRGLLNTLVIASTAPIVAYFFAEPRLVPLLLVLSLLPALEGTENIGIVEFRRDFRFEREFQLFLLPRFVSVVFTIVTALLFHSYWVLVLGNLVLRLVRWVLSYTMHPYRPRWSFAAWRKLIGFSLWTWAATIADFGRDRSWMIVLGRFLDTFQVGVFMIAIEIGSLPINEVVVPACRALFSGFTAARNEAGNFAYAFLRTVGVIALPILPASIGMSAVAAYIVDFALGPQWLSASMVIAWIAAASPLALLWVIGSTAMLVSGHVRNNFFIGAAYAVVGIVVCGVAAIYYGLWGVAVSRAALAAVEGVIYGAVTGRAIGISARDWMAHVWRPVVATAGMALALYLSGYGWITPSGVGTWAEALRFGDAMALGATVYTVVLLLCWVAAGCPKGAETFVLDFVPLGLGARARKLLVKT
jgi:O-antigen/teichoic acid export membrane protein